MDEQVIKDAIRKINEGEKSLEIYVNILKNKINNASKKIDDYQDQIQYIQHSLDETKSTLTSDKLLLEGLEAVILLSKSY